MVLRFAIVALVVWLSNSPSGVRADEPTAPHPAKSSGSLVVCGGGQMPQVVRSHFFSLAGGTEQARIVVIPTASEYADDPTQHDSFLAPWRRLEPRSLQLLHTRSRDRADHAEFAAPLREATAVWISGGDQNRLIETYRGTHVDHELRALLARGGVIGGTSAGAAVMSKLMIQGGNPLAQTGPGFGWLDGVVVDQHFLARNRLPRLLGVLANHPQLAGLGIDESTAAVVGGGQVRVLGTGTVTTITAAKASEPGQQRVWKSGESFELSWLDARMVVAADR